MASVPVEHYSDFGEDRRGKITTDYNRAQSKDYLTKLCAFPVQASPDKSRFLTNAKKLISDVRNIT